MLHGGNFRHPHREACAVVWGRIFGWLFISSDHTNALPHKCHLRRRASGLPESERMWPLSKEGSSQWEACFPRLLWKKCHHPPRSWKGTVGLLTRALHERSAGTEGLLAAVLLKNRCPQTGGYIPAGPGRNEEEKKGSHFPNSQYLVFPRQSWPGLHTSNFSKGSRLWEDF